MLQWVYGGDDSGHGDDSDKREEGFVERHRQECMKAVKGSCCLSVFRMILDSEGHEIALYKILSITVGKMERDGQIAQREEIIAG